MFLLFSKSMVESYIHRQSGIKTGREATDDGHLLPSSFAESLRPSHFPGVALHPVKEVRTGTPASKKWESVIHLKFLLHLIGTVGESPSVRKTHHQLDIL